MGGSPLFLEYPASYAAVAAPASRAEDIGFGVPGSAVQGSSGGFGVPVSAFVSGPRRRTLNAEFGTLNQEPSFVTQCLDRIEARRLEGGIHTEEDADRRREADADRERPPRQRDGEARREVHHPAEHGAEGHADEAAGRDRKS